MFQIIKINNTSGLQFFQLLRFGTLLLISIVFTKSSIGTDAIGDYEYFIFVAALVSSFWINGLIQSFLPLFKNNNSFRNSGQKSAEFFNVFILISIISFLVILLLIIVRFTFSKINEGSLSIPYFPLLLLYILFSSPSYLIEYIYLLKNKPDRILKYGIVSFLIHFILVALPVVFFKDMKISIVGLLIVSVIRYIWLMSLLAKFARFKLSVDFLKEHLHLALPLIISSLLTGSAQYVDGFLVLNKFDPSTFAIFRYGAKEFPLIVLMASAMSNAMIMEFTDKDKFAEALLKLRNKTKKLIHLLYPIAIIFILFSKWLYPRVFNENFVESAIVFNVYLLLIISRLVFPHTLLIGLKQTKIILMASFTELMINIVLSVIFIQFWGIVGVAFATVIAYGVQKMIYIIYNKIRLGIGPGKYIPISEWTIYSLLTVLVFILVT